MKKKLKKEQLQQMILAILLALAAAVMLIGVSMAWYTNQYRLRSIAKIHPLTYISILDPGDSVIQSIDLSYDKSEVEDGVITLKRPFVIRSEYERYDLCIAHTTNISGLDIKLYEAVENGSQGDAYLAGITDKGKPYYWNKADDMNLFVQEGYLNRGGDGLADKGNRAHTLTFPLIGAGSYNNVQKHAEPLYWVKTSCSGTRRSDGSDGQDLNFYTNYILEITWNETDKETDILYVIAKNGENS